MDTDLRNLLREGNSQKIADELLRRNSQRIQDVFYDSPYKHGRRRITTLAGHLQLIEYLRPSWSSIRKLISYQEFINNDGCSRG
jgi:hypothetical protein